MRARAGDDLPAAEGVLLAAHPACAEIGDGFTVNADGDADEWLLSTDLETADDCAL